MSNQFYNDSEYTTATDSDMLAVQQTREELAEVGRTLRAIAASGREEIQSFSVRMTQQGASINVTTKHSRFIKF